MSPRSPDDVSSTFAGVDHGGGSALGATAAAGETGALPTAECCAHPDIAEEHGIIWTGLDPEMTIERLAAYAAPVLWFSPDEPLLKEGPRRLKGKDIAIPTPFPFEEESEQPVVYYRVRRILQRVDEPGEGTYVEDPEARGQSAIDLRKVAGVDLDFFFYYPMDMGGNAHKHDVEYIETRITVGRRPDCAECPHVMGLMQVNAKAHGIKWFDNTLAVDASARLPLHILVEEGKHASCTDRNADGQFTPGYDVTERVNDAWGVRDTLGTGTFFTGDYKSWMTKIRQDDTRVFPPLTPDSPLRAEWSVDGEKELKDGHVTVFVPVAPTPGLGFLQIVSRSQLEKLERSMSDALGWPLTWGAGTEAVLGQKAP